MSKVIDFAEANFDCSLGNAAAFLECNDKQFPYVNYRVSGIDDQGIEDWLIDNVFRPLNVDGISLYWRNSEKIDWHFDEENYRYYVGARMVVLDKESNQVRLGTETPEGALCKKIENE